MLQSMIIEKQDVERLMADPSPEAKLTLVEKLTHQYTVDGAEHFKAEESHLAEDIFRLLMKNAETHVRAALAENLKVAGNVPHDIMMSMAKDVAEVSLPVLQFSDVLTEADLLEIVQSSNDEARHLAVASRAIVPEKISDALVEKGNEKVVSTLVKNEGAQITDNTFTKIVDRHAGSEAIVQSMIERGSLPIAVAEKMMEKVSGAIREKLKTKYEGLVEAKKLDKIVEQSLEVGTLKLMGLKTTDADLAKMLKSLGDTGKLSPFTALCMGDWHLFEVSMSRLARVPLNNVKILLNEKGEEGFNGLYEKADLPMSMQAAVGLAVKAMLALESNYAKSNVKALKFSPVEVMQKMTELNTGDIPNLGYIMSMMQHHLHG